MKKYKVHFEVRGHGYRIVSAESPEEAQEQVDGDMLDITDLENADLETICVDEVYQEPMVSAPKRKKKK